MQIDAHSLHHMSCTAPRGSSTPKAKFRSGVGLSHLAKYCAGLGNCLAAVHGPTPRPDQTHQQQGLVCFVRQSSSPRLRCCPCLLLRTRSSDGARGACSPPSARSPTIAQGVSMQACASGHCSAALLCRSPQCYALTSRRVPVRCAFRMLAGTSQWFEERTRHSSCCSVHSQISQQQPHCIHPACKSCMPGCAVSLRLSAVCCRGGLDPGESATAHASSNGPRHTRHSNPRVSQA